MESVLYNIVTPETESFMKPEYSFKELKKS